MNALPPVFFLALLALPVLAPLAVARAEEPAAAVPPETAEREDLPAVAEPPSAEALEPLAAQGDAKARRQLAWRLFQGVGAEKDEARAVALLAAAAEQGDAVSLRNLGLLRLEGCAALERDPAEGERLLRRAAEAGDWQACIRAAENCRDPALGVPDFDAARNWFRKAAERIETMAPDERDAFALFALGQLRFFGEGVAPDRERGLALVERAAELGEPQAQSFLGEVYRLGKGRPRDLARAFEWHLKAAQAGFAQSQYLVAANYWHGDGVAPDPEESYAWALKAAEQGHAQAAYNVARCLLDGSGTAPDHDAGMEWMRKAADLGSNDAENFLVPVPVWTSSPRPLPDLGIELRQSIPLLH